MRKLINDPDHVLPEMLEGLVRLSPGLALLPGSNVVLRSEKTAGVALISGGGAGHEPAHVGFVGPGLLHAAVAGDVFTSPSTDAVLDAIRAVAGLEGVLLIVKNYTGDRLNFGLAAEMARAEGIAAEMVIVADDTALDMGPDGVGPRGIAGTVLVHKVAGAAAAAGLDLASVKAEAEAAIAALGSMGVALSACTVPAAGKPGFTLADDEIELGLGIHGEAGVRRAPIEPADNLVTLLLDRILAQKGVKSGDRVALLINNLGATPVMELMIVARQALAVLEARGITVLRVWAGTFLTAIDMAGCSLSLMTLDQSRLARLDAPASAPAWIAGQKPQALPQAAPPARAEVAPGTASPPFEAAIRAVADVLMAAEPRLTAMDQAVGDGDLGISLARGSQAMLDAIPTLDLAHAPAALAALSGLLRRVLGGTSGPLYAVMLLRASRSLADAGTAKPQDWAAAFADGVAALADLGGGRAGDRTMLDALLPASTAFREKLSAGLALGDALKAAVEAAEAGAAATASMMPKRGRSSYLGARTAGHVDPGAEAVALWLGALARTVGG
ncbi:dihydroxyacetone kinase subunit DhaK [Acidisoma cellulosilytica]|uniref:Dihydroxyacetone kinase subunit DhaK n=1 Tax=Acidisoma cellulosilyticum TaxID=2802395 RepID=A0A963Z4S6_9PROT|nr:dihydroxyacetone kinase family protein [Acidisoma cellulosilyticum]MCB8882865.1 dihydroxyacetone kinase subunit DhaK [Acidisoma cellulosilyticum]